MTEIEKQALALLNEVAAEKGDEAFYWWDGWRACDTETEALCRAIERHEAFKQEVSEAAHDVLLHLEGWAPSTEVVRIRGLAKRFIIAKPDPLVDALNDSLDRLGAFQADEAARLRKALAARGLKIVEADNAS